MKLKHWLVSSVMMLPFMAFGEKGHEKEELAVKKLEEQKQKPFSDRFFGDFYGLRTALEKKGVTFELNYFADVTTITEGGFNKGPNALDNLFFVTEVDGEKAYNIPGNVFHFSLLNTNGGHPNARRLGSLEGVNNLEVVRNRVKIFELWVDQKLFNNKLSILAGVYNTAMDFYYLDASNNFIKPTYQIDQTLAQSGRGGPSVFPSPTVGVRFKVTPTPLWYVQGAVMNGMASDPNAPFRTQARFGDPNGYFMMAEAGVTPEATDAEALNKFGIGVWQYTRPLNDLLLTDAAGNPLRRHSHGSYVVSSYCYHEKNDQKYIAFARLNMGDGNTATVRWAGTAGLIFRGFLPKRPAGELGIGGSLSHNSSKFLRASAAGGTVMKRREKGIEVYYMDQLTQGLNMQVSGQKIYNPGAAPTVPNAYVWTARLIWRL